MIYTRPFSFILRLRIIRDQSNISRMAHAAVISLVHTLQHIIESPRPMILYETQQLQLLHYHLCFLLHLLETCPNGYEPLLAKIRDKAYEAEDLIESLVQQYHESWYDSIFSSCINFISSLPLPGLFDWGMGLRYRQLWRLRPFDTLINDFIDIIREHEVSDDYSCQDSDIIDAASSSADPSMLTPASMSFKDKKQLIVGHKDEFERTMDSLVNSVPKSRQVIPILGMGGIGKTTLALKLYNNPNVMDRFDIRAWVTIKQDHNLRELVQNLVDALPKVNDQKKEKLRPNDQKEDNLVDLPEQLHKSLYGRRYLIVMDDVWDTNVWDYFQRFFPDNGNSSRVILTTRHEKVALHAGGCLNPPHVMELLSDDECWELLHTEVDYCPQDLVATGMKIASSCKGLPLIVTVIAGLLSKGNKSIHESWENIAENLSSIITNDTAVAEILLLSYKHLPQHLKACFLYIGVFLRYYKIPVSKIIKLWVAEGFVKRVSDKTVEQVAEEYILDLVERSLVSVGQRKGNGRIKTILIHDLLRELCIREARMENLFRVVNREGECTLQGTNIPRRLSLDPNISDDDPRFECLGFIDPLYRGVVRPYSISRVNDICRITQTGADLRKALGFSRVRSLLYTGRKPIPSNRICNFMMLRVLDITHVLLFTFPLEILKLVHLRFLAFPYLGEIPESIIQLYNLETIIFSSLFKKTAPCPTPLPSAIWSLPKLRHLKFLIGYLCDFPCVLPGWRNFCFLGNLQSLSHIHASFCTMEVLDEVPNLKRLGIWIEEWDDAPIYVNNLICLQHLEVLKCIVRPFLGHNVLPIQSYDFVPHIAFPTGLKEITLSGCKIPWAYMSVIGSLPNLENLKLRNDAFVGTSWTPTDGEFDRLNFLVIDISNLVHWNADSAHFPSLRGLVLRCCLKLEEIPRDIAEIATLETIEIESCSLSAINSAKEILEEQKSYGNESLCVYIS